MELLFESTKNFEKELSKFPDSNKKKIVEKLNNHCALLESDERSPFFKKAYRPINFKGSTDSTLYALKLDRDIRVILTVDDDPIFEQIIITLLHVVRHSSLDKVFKGIAESLYQKRLNCED
jgi:mRNA-degrading endonuclease RelE of RelBE toxin-antitoxin system